MSETHKAWQLPISSIGKSRMLAHYFAVSAKTDKVEPAACGVNFNPGFAVPMPERGTADYAKAGKCYACQRAFDRGLVR